MDLNLGGKVALVTGASKGMGRAIAEQFAAEGAHVSICARGEHDLVQTAEELRRGGVGVLSTQADVRRAGDIQRVIQATLDTFGRVDVLVNNAGQISVPRTVDATDAQWQDTMEVNLLSAVRFTRGVVPHMRRQGGGRIVNISSGFAHTVPIAGSVDYNASKAALLSFSRTMAVELAADHILVNSVCPGWIESPMLDRLLGEVRPMLGVARAEDVALAFQQFLLIKRMGRPDEVAAIIVFLASDLASYITGSVYDVDGGFAKSI